MSLSKQITLLVAALFVLIFTVNFLLSLQNIKNYLQGEAGIHAQDTATSLGLSLSPYMRDEYNPVIETMIQAIFDRGYYREIKLVNLNHDVLVRKVRTDHSGPIPEWFMAWIPMSVARAESEISSGWTIKGIISVTIEPGYAYQKLYQQFKTTIGYSLIILFAALVLIWMMIRITLRPLKDLEQFALSVAECNFTRIDNQSRTIEIRNLAASMNRMSAKLAVTVDNINHKLKIMGRKLLRDDLTGLKNKTAFENDIKQAFIEDSGIYIYSVRPDCLQTLVKEHDSQWVDRFLIDFAKTLDQFTEHFSQLSAASYRLYAAEFALLIKADAQGQVQQTAEWLCGEFERLGRIYQVNDLAHMGIVLFNPVISIEQNLEAAHETYEQALKVDANSFMIRGENEHVARDIAQWKQLVFECIRERRYQIEWVLPVISANTGMLLMEEAYTRAMDSEGEGLVMTTFFSMAEKFSIIIELEKQVVKKVVEMIKRESPQHKVAVNVSTRTLKSTDFRFWLDSLLSSDPAVSSCLVFSLTAYAVVKDMTVYQEFIRHVHQLGARVLIKRYEIDSMPIKLCSQLQPDYIRLARYVAEGIAGNHQKQAFVQTLLEAGALLDITIYAENVSADTDVDSLKKLGIAGFSR